MNISADRYAADRRRSAFPALTQFAGDYSFPLDDFQEQACEALERGQGVLVCAPTGAGKTVVGEFAVHLALRVGRKCFYTTPIKALSNQKYADLVARYGPDQVGLLTGDNSINGEASIVVMTTEVLRNMLYAGSSTLEGLGYVVMDEVHYLADRFRGAVWEEVIIHLPQSVTLVSLSATVSNAEEFAQWLVTVRGHTTVIVSEHRPVPLTQHMLVGNRLFDLFREPAAHEIEPELLRGIRERQLRLMPGGRGSHPRPFRPPSRVDVIDRLDREGMLPAITFIFSRAGCDAAVAQCVRGGLRLNDPSEQAAVRNVVEQAVANLPIDDLQVLGYGEWLDGLERGVAAHHAGLIPTFKETVEELFVRGLVKTVFATETLALGINMPARSVILERLVKWNGETHADITPGEYTQLTGRAGRRGIDVEGHAVVVWAPDIDPVQVAGLASTRTYPLRSSFLPSYNMAVNLVGQLGRDAGRELLESSFAQFQADRSVVGLGRQVQRNTEALAGYRKSMQCHLGDFEEYAQLRATLKAKEASQARQRSAARKIAAIESLEKLHIGDVIRVPGGRRAGVAVVLDPGLYPLSEPRPMILTEDRWAGRLSAADFSQPVERLATISVPKHFNHRSPRARRDLAATLRTTQLREGVHERTGHRPRAENDEEITQLRRAIRAHPCHRCPDVEQHARWADRYFRLLRDTQALQRRMEGKTHSIPRTFDQVCALLEKRGYLHADEVTPAGKQLSRIWSEADLLIAECLRGEVWDGLSTPELAGAVSAVLYESRRDGELLPKLPAGRIREALGECVRLWGELADDERDHGLQLTREPDLGFVWPAYRWARGESLSRVLNSAEQAGQELSVGDFVRWCKQILDLLEQIASLLSTGRDGRDRRSDALREKVLAAIAAMRRGVVAYTGLG